MSHSPYSFSITAEYADNAVALVVRGRVDAVNAKRFLDICKAAINPAEGAVLDLKELIYISSSGLRSILLLAKQAQEADGRFLVCSISDSVIDVFKFTGLDKLLEIVRDRKSALATLGA